MNPFIHLSRTHCYVCGKEDLDLIDATNRRANYARLLRENKLDDIMYILNSREFVKMKCPYCNTEYHIDWSDSLPKPVTNYFLYAAFE